MHEEDAKDTLADVMETDTTNPEQSNTLKQHLLDAFKHAQSDIRHGERPKRSLVRFSLNLMKSFLSRLCVKEGHP